MILDTGKTFSPPNYKLKIVKWKCFWWNEKIIEKDYWNISAFSWIKNKEKIIEEVKNIHSDKCPIIAFTSIDGNEEFLEWIGESMK